MQQQIGKLSDKITFDNMRDRRGFKVFCIEGVNSIDLDRLQHVLRRYGANAFLRLGSNAVKVDVYVPKHLGLRRFVWLTWGMFLLMAIVTCWRLV